MTGTKDIVENCIVAYAWEYEQDVKATLRDENRYAELVEEATDRGWAPAGIEWPALGDDQREEQTFAFVATPCHLGGVRLWFRCRGPTETAECGQRVGALYRPSHRPRFACRECWNLSYENRQRKGNPFFETVEKPLRRRQAAANAVLEDSFVRERWRKLYEATQDTRTGLAGWLPRFNMAGMPEQIDIGEPSFEEWLDERLQPILGGLRGRPYGEYGRCEASAKTTGERCRQPAVGSHGKCYYHGGG